MLSTPKGPWCNLSAHTNTTLKLSLHKSVKLPHTLCRFSRYHFLLLIRATQVHYPLHWSLGPLGNRRISIVIPITLTRIFSTRGHVDVLLRRQVKTACEVYTPVRAARERVWGYTCCYEPGTQGITAAIAAYLHSFIMDMISETRTLPGTRRNLV